MLPPAARRAIRFCPSQPLQRSIGKYSLEPPLLAGVWSMVRRASRGRAACRQTRKPTARRPVAAGDSDPRADSRSRPGRIGNLAESCCSNANLNWGSDDFRVCLSESPCARRHSFACHDWRSASAPAFRVPRRLARGPASGTLRTTLRGATSS